MLGRTKRPCGSSSFGEVADQSLGCISRVETIIHVDSKSLNGQTSRWNTIFPPKPAFPNHLVAPQGLGSRDVAFMERLRNLAREALTWEHLSDQRRLVWAAALELDVVPVQEMRVVGRGCRIN